MPSSGFRITDQFLDDWYPTTPIPASSPALAEAISWYKDLVYRRTAPVAPPGPVDHLPDTMTLDEARTLVRNAKDPNDLAKLIIKHFKYSVDDNSYKKKLQYRRPTTVTPTKNEEDMFASRTDDDDTYRLCIRRGRPIRSIVLPTGEPVPLIFKTAKKAKDCADELNEKFFDEYDKVLDREGHFKPPHNMFPEDLRKNMCETIMKYAKLPMNVRLS